MTTQPINYGDTGKIAREKINSMLAEVEAHIPSIGENNHWYLWETDTGINATWPQGETWPQWATWPQWPQGEQGEQWEQGIQGETWPQGEQWPQGEDWEDGYTPVKWVDYFTEQDIESLNIPQTLWDLDNDVGYITSDDLPTKLSDLQNDEWFITNTVNNLTNYYNKNQTYTQSEVDDLIWSIVGVEFTVVQSLPQQWENGVIYLLPNGWSGSNVYDEYIRLNSQSKFEKIWTTEVDLSNYYTKNQTYSKTEIDNQLSWKADTSTTYTKTEVNNLMSWKQDTINDLSDIRTGAGKGATAVQPWDNISTLNNNAGYITDSDLPTKVSDLENDSWFVASSELNEIAFNWLTSDNAGTDISIATWWVGEEHTESWTDKITVNDWETLNWVKAYGWTYQWLLPQWYTQIEYTQNNGSTRILTDFIPTVDDIEFDVTVKPTTWSWYIFQSRTTSSSQPYGISGSASGATISFSMWGTDVTSEITRNASKIYRVVGTGKNGNLSLYVNNITDSEEDTKTGTYTFTAGTMRIWLFWNTSSQYVNSGNRIYRAKLKIWWELVLDYIPCKNANNQIWFYDLVSKRFVWATTWTFTAGGDSRTWPSPAETQKILCNNWEIKASRNLFDASSFTWGTSTAITYTPIYVWDGIFTMSTPDFVKASWLSNMFFLAGNVSTGANSSTNWVSTTSPITQTAVNGYVTVAERAAAAWYTTPDPKDCHRQIIKHVNDLRTSSITLWGTIKSDPVWVDWTTSITRARLEYQFLKKWTYIMIDNGGEVNSTILYTYTDNLWNWAQIYNSVAWNSLPYTFTLQKDCYIRAMFRARVSSSDVEITDENLWNIEIYNNDYHDYWSWYVEWQTETIQSYSPWTTESDMRWPCKSWFHVPTKEENIAVKDTLTALWIDTSTGACLKTYLKMPYAWARTNAAGVTNSQWSGGTYWSSSSYWPNYAYYLSCLNYVAISGSRRSIGCSIRPQKNVAVVPSSTWITLYDGSSVATGAWIFHNPIDEIISISADWTNWITIADKNVWATQVYNDWDTLSEANCGKYFQHGNNHWFPFTGNITISSVKVDASWYWPWKRYESDTFIITSWEPYSWDTSNNLNLWGWSTQGTYVEKVVSGTATAENLFKLSEIYWDEQEILDGDITRKVWVVVFTGDESWTYSSNRIYGYVAPWLTWVLNTDKCWVCSHFTFNNRSTLAYINDWEFLFPTSSWKDFANGNVGLMNTDAFENLTTAKAWLREQYASWNWVILVYPLATETTSSVSGQTLWMVEGENSYEVVESWMSGLGIAINYYEPSTTLKISFTKDWYLLPSGWEEWQVLMIVSGVPTWTTLPSQSETPSSNSSSPIVVEDLPNEE